TCDRCHQLTHSVVPVVQRARIVVGGVAVDDRDEQATIRAQAPRHLSKKVFLRGQEVERLEDDDRIEGGVVERQAQRVTLYERHRVAVRAERDIEILARV